MKRTRYTRKYVIHLPRIAIREPGIYEITIKNPTLVIEKVGDIPHPREAGTRKERHLQGEIERGSSDTDE